MGKKRKALSRSVRFEVFKRDSFKCQYCGATAPEAVLHVDHIEPVSKGGENDIVNLITACLPCNLGKKDRRLSDDTAVMKARGQLEELQERREQLEMVMEWKTGLRDLTSQAVERLSEYWRQLTPGWNLNGNGKFTLEKRIKKYGVEKVLKAMDVSAAAYLRLDESGRCTPESQAKAWDKVDGVLYLEALDERDPELRQMYRLRSWLRKKTSARSVDWESITYMKRARAAGASIKDIEDVVRSSRGWMDFSAGINALVGGRKWLERA